MLIQRPNNQWTRWFAWYPVKTVDEEYIWLEMVERRLYHAKIPNVRPSSWIIYRKLTNQN